jgi:hypothetical protein
VQAPDISDLNGSSSSRLRVQSKSAPAQVIMHSTSERFRASQFQHQLAGILKMQFHLIQMPVDRLAQHLNALHTLNDLNANANSKSICDENEAGNLEKFLSQPIKFQNLFYNLRH